MSSLETIGNETFMWGGLDLNTNQTTNELYLFHNISFSTKTGDPTVRCRMFPSPETAQKSGYSRIQLSQFGTQIGEVPKARMGHALIGLSESLIMIGGHTKEWNGQCLTFKNMKENIYHMNIASKKWTKISILEGDSQLLQRSLFMYCILGNDVYITGGNIYCEGEVKRHTITDLLKLNIDLVTNTASLQQILIEHEKINLSSATMTQNESKLYIFGGLQETNDDSGRSVLVCSGKFYCIDLQQKKIESITVPLQLQENCKVYGSSSVWFENHTLVIISGTRPGLGHGFRSIFSYSCFDNREMKCQCNCCLIENATGNIIWVQCDHCDSWIHNFCDPIIRSRTNPLKRTEKYICERCRSPK